MKGVNAVEKIQMSPETTSWMRRAVVGLAAFAFVGNAGHAYEMLNDNKLGGQEWWLAGGGAALPDVLLLVCVIKLRHDRTAKWAWLGLVLACGFVLWAGYLTAADNAVARICSAWPLSVAVTAAGLLEYSQVAARSAVDRTTDQTVVQEPDHSTDQPVRTEQTDADQPVDHADQTTRTGSLHLVRTGGPDRASQLLPAARDVADRLRPEGADPEWVPARKPLIEGLREHHGESVGATVAGKLLEALAAGDQGKESALA